MSLDAALEIVLDAEGGYSDDPDDAGGKTRYGITESVARDNGYMGQMSELPLDLAKSIYRKDYWDVCKCDLLRWPMSLYVFDAAVNQGCNPAIKMLQSVVGVKSDGLFGPVTAKAVMRSGPEAPALYMAARAQRYVGTRSYDKFGKGWLKRLFIVTQRGEGVAQK